MCRGLRGVRSGRLGVTGLQPQLEAVIPSFCFDPQTAVSWLWLFRRDVERDIAAAWQELCESRDPRGKLVVGEAALVEQARQQMCVRVARGESVQTSRR